MLPHCPIYRWVAPALLCFADPTSSEMALDAPGRLWCPCLLLRSQRVSPITRAGLSSWLFSLPCASVSLQVLVLVFARPLQGIEGLRVHPRSLGGG